uniref:Uncharacterized protein n=1 Tax=Anguilla anguilla TaxID=7936 RepID=A0A0E9S9L6_ANGAN
MCSWACVCAPFTDILVHVGG